MTINSVCAVPTCHTGCRPNHLMCRGCWVRVSKRTQRRVYRTWSAYQRAVAQELIPTRVRKAAKDYASARAKAIEEVM